MTRTITRLTAAGALLIALAGCSTGTTESPAAPTSAAPEWLFVVQSTGVSTVDAATGTVTMPTDTVEAFTDRPIRESRAMEPSDFADLWRSQAGDSFATDPPNAALTYWVEGDQGAQPRSLTCEVVDAVSYTAVTGSLRFALRPMDGSPLDLPERLINASLFIDDTPMCTSSPDDEANVEYFNMENFDDVFSISVQRSTENDDMEIGVVCPERESASIPRTSFDMRISTPDGSVDASCYDALPTIAVDPSALADSPNCTSDGRCSFLITALNTITLTVYSRTSVSVDVTTPTTFQPDLSPATLPLCPNELGG